MSADAGARRMLVIGLGKRVREAVLPAVARTSIEVAAVVARSKRDEVVDGRSYSVVPFDTLDAARVREIDLIYLAVGKNEVPAVLNGLESLGVGHADLLIDTPVVRFKHLIHARKLAAFRSAWVPEDCAFLPWFDAVARAADKGLGAPLRAHFERSAYAYHGLASGKALLSAGRIVRASRSASLRTIELVARGAPPAGAITSCTEGTRRTMTVREPRDYSSGWVRIDFETGAVSDNLRANPGATPLSCIFERVGDHHVVAGIRCGSVATELDDEERSLTLGVTFGSSVIALQEAMKRVGLLRLLRQVERGGAGYPVIEGLDDMVVDYHLERFRRYRANPLTSARGVIRRAVGLS